MTRKPALYAWIAFALVFGLMLSDYLSRQVITAIFPLLKSEWDLTDTQLGSLVSVVSVTVGVLTLPISFVADRWGLVKSAALMALCWAMATVACGFAGNFLFLFVARALVDVIVQFFEGVQSGRTQVSFVHPETASATRRIVTFIAWTLAVVVAYPFIPGSNSDAFKGLSVLFGVMLSLGSTGLVTQMMSGLVVIYSRALRKGDYVSVNGIDGMVSEVGTLATKVVTMRNEEITIPNSVLIGNPIHNFSKLAGTQGTMVSTKVTIGYDAPWRQVHAMLEIAAQRTPGLRREPKPHVYQRALQDFYVEYELFAHIDRPLERVATLSALHANIQDAFNEFGVQILSPHFVMQPRQAVVVPPERWHEKPAQPPPSAKD